MGYESYLRLLSLVYCMYIFEFESNRRFQFSFTDFSLVYRSAFAQIFARSQPTRESNTSTYDDLTVVMHLLAYSYITTEQN
jgi:hypothetical protein